MPKRPREEGEDSSSSSNSDVPKKRKREKKRKKDPSVCPICLEDNNAKSDKFCCGNFHNNCIIENLKQYGKCPLCKYRYSMYKRRLNYNNCKIKNMQQLMYEIVYNLELSYNYDE